MQHRFYTHVSGTRRQLGLTSEHGALLILDVYKAHCTETFPAPIATLNIKVRFVPGRCTGELQPLDVGVNHMVKREMKTKFTDIYSSEIQEALGKG